MRDHGKEVMHKNKYLILLKGEIVEIRSKDAYENIIHIQTEKHTYTHTHQGLPSYFKFVDVQKKV